MGYEEAHRSFIQEHIDNRSGERRGKLERGHGHAESLFLRNVWWPLRGDFQHLHPEYEVLDWRGRSYFADFAWLPGRVKLIFEIKGFASHVRDMDRQKYCNELNREAFLHAMGFHVISFAYDDVEKNPGLCMTMLRMVTSRYQSGQSPITRALLAEKEIIRLAIQRAEPIRPKDVERHFEIDQKTAVNLLQKLCAKGWLLPYYRGNRERIVRYELAHDFIRYLDD
ncbi:DUF559 domain-containing protein [Paenibacillus sp. PL91]|uniref:DUF559 domain-containing protein n=1 Tax=Paenibacillus sp. PL91 TaxID=2729538 RepID=UPI00145EBDBF|nr:DUF559 domain-containing protein [Paenibacillus sp. PL91]MBC9201770.1 DUF559 domain-containing protein [Paenibacillus sp. PL91]